MHVAPPHTGDSSAPAAAKRSTNCLWTRVGSSADDEVALVARAGGLRDPVGIVEAAYRLEGTEEQWLRFVLEAIEPSFPGSVGGFFCDRAPADGRWVWGTVGIGVNEALLAGIPGLYESLSAERRVKLLSVPPVMTLSESARIVDDEALASFAHALGVVDSFTLSAIDATGRGCLVGAVSPVRLKLDSRARVAWARVGAHLAAGLRLRRALASFAAEPVEAVLSVDGKLEHAEGPARDVTARAELRRAARDIERARTELRRSDPEAALATWRALTAGRWSLIDRFEENGRRYVVALKNDFSASDPRRLTERERMIAAYVALGRPNKLIAYSLGIAEGTVAAMVARIVRKLGARGRADCARMLNEWQELREGTESCLTIAGSELAVLSVPAQRRISGLTDREHSLASAVAQGHKNADIARALGCSPRTVANSLARIYRKARVGSRAELAQLLAGSAMCTPRSGN